MRLKIPPKEALIRLDALVKTSHHRVADIDLYFGDVLEKAREQHWNNLADESIPITEKNENNPHHVPLPKDEKRKLDDMYNGWHDAAVAELRGIFQDYVPVYTFLKVRPENKVDPEGPEVASYKWLMDIIEMKIEVLMDFYQEVEKSVKSPLMYLPDRAQICFYDFVCPLGADTNEAALCAFLFRHSVGEKVEMLDIYDYMTGEGHPKLDTSGKAVVTNAYDGINRKTKTAFGFPLLRKDGVTLCLALPPIITSALT